MTERPILFSAPMVCAILSGAKTQTRRPISRVARLGPVTEFQHSDTRGYDWIMRDRRMRWNDLVDADLRCRSPYGQPGDRLWVRETFAIESQVDGAEDNDPPHEDGRPIRDTEGVGWQQPHYRATDPVPGLECDHLAHVGGPCPRPWRSQLTMPRWASRIDLEITRVRVERVRDITEDDARAEGVAPMVVLPGDAVSWASQFAHLWDSINLGRGFGWGSNPWVWVVDFRRVRP